MRKLEIYLHIPFCVRKCAYCDFLSAPAGRAEQKAYMEALCREISSFPNKEVYEVSSVFFGGGTPSLLPGGELAGVLELLHREFRFLPDAEITVECNPGTADEEKLRAYRNAGVNRLSLGLQSADNRELELLGRIHTWEDFLETYEAARRVGFSNINIDLMSALPGQTVSSWENTLRQVLALCPQHISAYSLIIEEGTPFYERYHADAELRECGGQPRLLPSEEAERQMYVRTDELLRAAGMHRYEISNYALPGYECRHNIGYWDGTEYAGFGLGASSLLRIPAEVLESDGVEHAEVPAVSRVANPPILSSIRVRNTEKFKEYLEEYRSARKTEEGSNGRSVWKMEEGSDSRSVWKTEEDLDSSSVWELEEGSDSSSVWITEDEPDNSSGREIVTLTDQDQMEEFMFLGLRMMEGVSETEFQKRFGKTVDEVYGAVLDRQQELGLLERKDGRIYLTPRGIDVSNAVMAEFLL